MSDLEQRASAARLISGTLWNMAGRGLPLLLAVALTPILIAQLGLERWGVFTLALAMVGMFGMLDLGVGPALTRTLSERIGRGEAAGNPALALSAMVALAAFGAIGAAAVFLGIPALVRGGLNVPPGLQAETIAALRVLVASAPLVVVNAALWGVLAAYQAFRSANLVTAPVAVFYYLGPVIVLSVWNSLIGAMLALVACRLANTVSYAWLARPYLRGARLRDIRLATVKPLLRLGGWLTVASMLTQALLYADRFLIGAMLTLAAVAFYATPLDLVMRFWILPVAVAQALLPAFSSSFRAMPGETAALLNRGTMLILLLVLPASLVLALAAGPLLDAWLGAEFAAGSAMVARILAVGILFNCLAFAPGSLIEAAGRADLLAKLALLQVGLFIPLSALLIHRDGIVGAAIAWSARTAFDWCGRLLIVRSVYPPAARTVEQLAVPSAVACASVVAVAALPVAWPSAILATTTLLVVAALSWRALSPTDRAFIVARVGR
jgi:O-antigen/teichoic acid export membrane protein